jgi:uncharacterized protein (DUF58 family)
MRWGVSVSGRSMPAEADRVSSGAERNGLLGREDIAALERLSLESLDAILAGLVGEREASGRTVGFEFADYRPYVPGDDVRRIDWNIYARLHELHVRTSPQEASLYLSVLLDASRSMDSGEPNKLFYGRRLAALLGAVALLRDDAVEVHTLADGASADSGSFDSGSDVLGTMVDELERLPAGRSTELRESIRRAATSGWQPEMAVLISDGLVPREELAAAALELARSARSATFVHVTDPAGMVRDWAGSTLLLDSETGRRIDATITPDVQRRYTKRYARLSAEIERQCRANGVRYVKADTSVDPLEFLIARAREQSFVRTALAG